MIFDAHNHLHSARFGSQRAEVLQATAAAGVKAMAVNGTHPEDWDAVVALWAEAANFGVRVWPQFGVHPWKVEGLPKDWLTLLRARLVADPAAGVGEVGLDRWKPGLDFEVQRGVFRAQLELAAELDRPLSLHCLKAWGPLLEELRAGPLPQRGIMLHGFGSDYGVACELLALPTRVLFAFNGYFLAARKEVVREAFRRLPPAAVVLESDAPDMLPPEFVVENQEILADDGQALNSPAWLQRVVAAADFLPPLERMTATALEFFGGADDSL